MCTQCLEGSYGIIIQEAKIIEIKYSTLSTGALAVTPSHSAADMPAHCYSTLNVIIVVDLVSGGDSSL